jgi:hypothetical protein
MVGIGIWRETLKNEKNDKCTLQDMTYGENTDKKMRKSNGRNSKMSRNTEKHGK